MMTFSIMLSLLILANNIEHITQLSEPPFTFQYHKNAASPSHCHRSVAKCVALNSTQCLDVTLPYKHTSPPLFVDVHSISQIISKLSSSSPGRASPTVEELFENYLSEWKGLRAIPQCWKALQSVLCASFYPRCDLGTSRVILPVYEMCRAVRGPCRLLDKHFIWPQFLRCDNQSLFAPHRQSATQPKCENRYTDYRFVTSTIENSRCQAPLVNTKQEQLWYHDIDGCSLRCDPNPLYNDEQHSQITVAINIGAIIAFVLTCFGWLTFMIDSNRPNRYPAKMIMFVNMCLMISYVGWLLPHVLDRKEITCRADNTVRHGSQLGHSYCILSFTILYYFSMTALAWFVMFAYCCMISYRTTGRGNGGQHRTRSDQLASKETAFHMIGWVVPFVLTFIIWLTGEIDGDSMFGVCFVGLANGTSRVVFVFIPLCVGFVSGVSMLARTLNQLNLIRNITLKDLNLARRDKKCQKITRWMYRIVFVLLLSSIGFFTSFYLQFHQNHLTSYYLTQLNRHIVCSLNISANTLEPMIESSEFLVPPPIGLYEDGFGVINKSDNSTLCEHLKVKADLTPLLVQLLCIFGSSLIGCVWIFTYSTWATWKRVLYQLIRGRASSSSSKSTKHKYDQPMVDEDEANTEGTSGNNNESKRPRVGLSDTPVSTPGFYLSKHWDPVEFDLTSIASQSWNNSLRDKLFPLVHRSTATQSSDQGAAFTLSLSQPNSTTPGHTLDQSTSDVSNSVTTNAVLSFDSISLVETRSTKQNQQRKRKNLIRVLKRRTSDSSGSLFSTAFIAVPKSQVPVDRQETKSTSTGDLHLLSPDTHVRVTPGSGVGLAASAHPMLLGTSPQQQQQALLAQTYLSSNMMTPFMTQPMMLPPSQMAQLPFGHNMSSFLLPNSGMAGPMFQPQPQPFLQQAQVAIQNANNFPAPSELARLTGSAISFTHGMSDQASQLVDPLKEVRRPDSKLSDKSNSNKQANRSPTKSALGSNQVVMPAGVAQMSQLSYQSVVQQQYLPHYNPYGFNSPTVIPAATVQHGQMHDAYYDAQLTAANLIHQIQQKAFILAQHNRLQQQQQQYTTTNNSSVDLVFPITISSNTDSSTRTKPNGKAQIYTTGAMNSLAKQQKEVKTSINQVEVNENMEDTKNKKTAR